MAKKGNTARKSKKKTTAKKTTERARTSLAGRKTAAKRQNKKLPVLTGHIEGNAKGFGFFVCDDKTVEDLFIPPNRMCGALHGDRVEAHKISENRGSGEAEIIRVLERVNNEVVGEFRKSGDYGFVTPDNHKICKDIFIAAEGFGGASNGDKVVVTITDYPEKINPEGRITEILGRAGIKETDMLSVIRAHGLKLKFDEKTLKEADKVPSKITEKDIANRHDFRDEVIVTIDGDDSKDFDDAVTVTMLPDGNYRLGVHIADVAQYVRPGTALDKEALERGTSVYLCDRVLPMLPEKLSNGICSLNEGADRLSLSIVMEVDAKGKVVKSKIEEGVIRSGARLTYNKVAAILDNDRELCRKYEELVPMIRLMKKLAGILERKRKNRGSVDFDLPECKIIIGADGNVEAIEKAPRLISHRIIEEFMLLANETVAKTFEDLQLPFVYRVHEKPPIDKMQPFSDFLSALGIKFPGEITSPVPADFEKLLEEVPAEIKPIVSRVALRAMTKAYYHTENLGHFGLAAKYYCHFTSPIRRYPDLMIHRIIKEYLAGGKSAVKKYEEPADYAAKRSSIKERAAEETERKVDSMKKAEYMSGKIGETFVGTVSGVTEWGIFVELDNTVEGLVRTENLPGEGGFIYNQLLHRLDGNGTSYKLGDTLKVVVVSVSDDRVNFELAPSDEDEK